MTNLHSDYLLVQFRKLTKGQLFQPARGKLFRVIENPLPFVYIVRRESWRHA